MRKTYHGSCHCGLVKFEATIDLADGIRKCNCTFCYKAQMLKVFTKDLKMLTSPLNLNSDYKAKKSNWPSGNIIHSFCRNCGMRTFGKGYLELKDIPMFNGWFYCVNLATLDDVTPEEFSKAPKIYEDGLHDKPFETPKEIRHL